MKDISDEIRNEIHPNVDYLNKKLKNTQARELRAKQKVKELKTENRAIQERTKILGYYRIKIQAYLTIHAGFET